MTKDLSVMDVTIMPQAIFATKFSQNIPPNSQFFADFGGL